MPPKLLKRMTTRRVAPRAAVADKDADLVCVAVIPAVELALRASWPGGKAAAGAFEILGPESVLQYIGGSSSKTGVLSPTSIVTVPANKRQPAGIPLAAASYAYIHPLDMAADARDSILPMNLCQQPGLYVCLVGGFAYFDADNCLLQVNAITYAPSATGLVLVGRHLRARSAYDVAATMRRQGRMAGIQDADLLAAGFQSSGWVHASETFDGAVLPLDPAHGQYEHGAFLFERTARRRVGAGGAAAEREARGASADDDNDDGIPTLELDDGAIDGNGVSPPATTTTPLPPPPPGTASATGPMGATSGGGGGAAGEAESSELWLYSLLPPGEDTFALALQEAEARMSTAAAQVLRWRGSGWNPPIRPPDPAHRFSPRNPDEPGRLCVSECSDCNACNRPNHSAGARTVQRDGGGRAREPRRRDRRHPPTMHRRATTRRGGGEDCVDRAPAEGVGAAAAHARAKWGQTSGRDGLHIPRRPRVQVRRGMELGRVSLLLDRHHLYGGCPSAHSRTPVRTHARK